MMAIFLGLGLALVALGVRVLQSARRIDRLALAALLVLGVATRPGREHHRTEIANTITADATGSGRMRSVDAREATAVERMKQLEHADCLLFTATTSRRSLVSVGLFGRVFVL